MHMITSTRQAGGVTIVDIRGRIVLGEESAALRDLVCDLLCKGHKKILLNLGDVNYIDSSGLGNLVSALASVRKQEGELKLLNLTNKVHDVMQITRLYTVFDIMDDEAVAVKSFRSIGSGNRMTVELEAHLHKCIKMLALRLPANRRLRQRFPKTHMNSGENRSYQEGHRTSDLVMHGRTEWRRIASSRRLQ